ncbi:MAG: hypothetical protein AAF358_20975 [Pseudomonadota bacterium]
MTQATQRQKRRCWIRWLLLAASIPSAASAQSSDLIDRLGLPPGDYWYASNGLAIPLTERSADPAPLNEVLVLRREDGELQPVGWFEITEETQASAPSTATQVTVDGTQPQGSMRLSGSWLTADGGRLMAAPSVRLVLSFKDPAGLDRWVLSDTHPISISGGRWRPGLHQLTALAGDAFGNEGVAAKLSFEVDGAGPELNWAIESEALGEGSRGAVYQPPVSLSLNADDPAGVATLELDRGAGWEVVAAGAPLAISASRASLRATDRLGNTTVSEASWRYDREPPEIRVLAEGVELAEREEVALPVGGVLTILVTDEGAGVENATYRYNGTPPQPLPETIRFVDRGWYQVQLRAIDRLGNERVRHVDVRTSPRRSRPMRAADTMKDDGGSGL